MSDNKLLLIAAFAALMAAVALAPLPRPPNSAPPAAAPPSGNAAIEDWRATR